MRDDECPPLRNSTLQQVKGTFGVRRAGKSSICAGDGAHMGRIRPEKVFHDTLDATSVGELTSAGTSTKRSAAYVAIEYVSGRLDGRVGALASRA